MLYNPPGSLLNIIFLNLNLIWLYNAIALFITYNPEKKQLHKFKRKVNFFGIYVRNQCACRCFYKHFSLQVLIVISLLGWEQIEFANGIFFRLPCCRCENTELWNCAPSVHTSFGSLHSPILFILQESYFPLAALVDSTRGPACPHYPLFLIHSGFCCRILTKACTAVMAPRTQKCCNYFRKATCYTFA